MLVCTIQEYMRTVKSDKKRPLSGLSAELTRRCNFKCGQCYCANPIKPYNPEEELRTDEWIRIFEQYADEQGLFLTLTGGEPLLRKDFKTLWRFLKQKGFLISLFTNGSLIDEKMVDFLAEWTPYELSITLYGASDETYERVTGHKNMFTRIMSTLEILSETGIPLEVKGVFTRLNIDDFDQVKSIGEQYCDLFRWDVDLIGAFPCSSNKVQDIRLSPEECVELEARVRIRNQELLNRIKNWQPAAPPNGKRSAFTCNIGKSSAYIDCYGGMHPCLPLESVSYDLRQGSLEEGWHEAIPKMIRDFPLAPGPCQTCDAFELCGQCVAFALLEGCSPTGPVPFRCRLAKARAKQYGLSHRIKSLADV